MRGAILRLWRAFWPTAAVVAATTAATSSGAAAGAAGAAAGAETGAGMRSGSSGPSLWAVTVPLALAVVAILYLRGSKS